MIEKTSSQKIKRQTLFLIFLSGVGFLVSFYSVLHYFGWEDGGWCNWSEVLSCDIVNKSVYAQIFGIPVSVLGLIGYSFLGLTAWFKYREQERDSGLTVFLILAVAAGFIFSVYLTAIEAFILRAFCPSCLISQITIALMFIIVIRLFSLERRER